jgi:hypothetical protein
MSVRLAVSPEVVAVKLAVGLGGGGAGAGPWQVADPESLAPEPTNLQSKLLKCSASFSTP